MCTGFCSGAGFWRTTGSQKQVPFLSTASVRGQVPFSCSSCPTIDRNLVFPYFLWKYVSLFPTEKTSRCVFCRYFSLTSSPKGFLVNRNLPSKQFLSKNDRQKMRHHLFSVVMTSFPNDFRCKLIFNQLCSDRYCTTKQKMIYITSRRADSSAGRAADS